IVENYLELKQALIAAGAVFTSETDAEVIAHLLSRDLSAGNDLVEAVRATYLQLRGHYAFVAVAADDQALLVAARRERPLVVGRGGACGCAAWARARRRRAVRRLRRPALPRADPPRPVHRERRDRRPPARR